MLPYGNTAPSRYMDAVAQIPRMLFDSTANNRLLWRQKESQIESKYVHSASQERGIERRGENESNSVVLRLFSH